MKRGHPKSHPNRKYRLLLVVCIAAMAALFLPSAVSASTVSASGVSPSYQGWIGRSLNANGNLSGVSCPSASVCYLAGGNYQNGYSTIEKTTDGGASWAPTTIAATAGIGTLDSISCSDVTHCVATGGGNGGTAYATTDGVHWSALALPAGTAELLGVTCLTVTTCWAVGSDATGVMTTDGGTTWVVMPYSVTAPGGAKLSSFGVAFVNAKDGVVTGGASCQAANQCPGYAQVTTDGGHTWSFAALPAGAPFLSDVTCLSGGQCTAVGGTFTHAVSYRSTDSGATWSGLANPAGMQFANGVTCYDSSNCVAVGQSNTRYSSNGTYETSDAALARTTDGGAHWTAQNATGAAIYLAAVSCPTVTTCTAVGASLTSDAVVQTTDGGVPPPAGYWFVASDGGVFAYGSAHFYGSTGGIKLNKPVVGMAADTATGGYWLVASDGGVFAYHAPFYGSTGNLTLAKPIVGISEDPATGGYWFVASDGGIFSYHAAFYGSMGGKPLSAPIVAMATTPDGGGYWLLGRDGALYAFGTARYDTCKGTPGTNQPFVGLAVDRATRGLWLVTDHGAIWTCNTAAFYGDTSTVALAKPIVGIAADPATGGYWLVGSDGGIFAYHAPFLGSTGNIKLNKPIVEMTSVPLG
jgi:hypothetical protein